MRTIFLLAGLPLPALSQAPPRPSRREGEAGFADSQVDALRCRALFLTFAALLMLNGCTDTDRELATGSGTVQVHGQPVSGVVITLQPIPPTTGPKASAAVLDGRFEFASDAGLHGGQYRVRFSLMPKEVREQFPAEATGNLPSPDAVIGPKYDSRSKLTWALPPGQQSERAFKIEYR